MTVFSSWPLCCSGEPSHPESRPQASDTALLAPCPLSACSSGQRGDSPGTHVLWHWPSPSQLSCGRLPLSRSGGDPAQLPGCGPWEAAQMSWLWSLVAGQVWAAPEPRCPLSSANLRHSLNLTSPVSSSMKGIFLLPKKVCQEGKLEPGKDGTWDQHGRGGNNKEGGS